MTRLEVKVPDQPAQELQQLVQSGWFESLGEITRLALLEFIERHRFQLQEKFQRADIAWAIDLAKRGKKTA